MEHFHKVFDFRDLVCHKLPAFVFFGQNLVELVVGFFDLGDVLGCSDEVFGQLSLYIDACGVDESYLFKLLVVLSSTFILFRIYSLNYGVDLRRKLFLKAA